jgi:hypothetical protein
MEKLNMAHQYSNLDHEERRYAYFAALLDGEGTIGMRPQGRGYSFRLRVEMADHEMMSRITGATWITVGAEAPAGLFLSPE